MRLVALWVVFCLTVGAADKSDLRIRAAELSVAREGTLIVELINDSNHELRLPPVTAFCVPAPGAINAKIIQQPPTPDGQRFGLGCSACGGTVNTAVLERTKQWPSLLPGQAVRIAMDLKTMLPLSWEGVYKFRLHYSHADFTADELMELRSAHVQIPSDSESDPISVDLRSGRLLLVKGAL